MAELTESERRRHYLNFIKRLNLVLEADILITIKGCEILPPVYDLHFEKYNLDFTIGDTKFSAEIITSAFEKNNIIRRLKIDILERAFVAELRSCLNYLQRKRDLSHALNVLKKYVELHKHRERIMMFVMNELGDYTTFMFRPEDGIIIKCNENGVLDKYFEVAWKICWNVTELNFFDAFRVQLNREYTTFYQHVRPIFGEMIIPSNFYDHKRLLWSIVISNFKDYVNSPEAAAIKCRINATHNLDWMIGPIEINDSDSEDDVIEQCSYVLPNGNVITLD